MGTTTDLNPTPFDSTGWTTTFFDGFNGSSLDRQKWSSVYDGAVYWNGAFEWDADQLSVGNGELTIGMEQRGDGLWNVGGLATLSPHDPGTGFDFTYGRVEIRAKVSQELWGAGPCFLLWPSDGVSWPPELDILETPKGEGMFTNHWQGSGGQNHDEYQTHFFDIDVSEWHTYTVDWFANRVTLYVDGQEIVTYTSNITNDPMSVALQGHVGTATDGWYGSPNGSGVGSVDISVDYVKVEHWIAGGDPGKGHPIDDGDKIVQPPKDPDPPRDITGTPGADALAGGSGADTITAGAGSDDLSGGAGDDRLVGGKDHDGLTGGAGADTFVFAKGDGDDWIVDFTAGTDRLELHGFAATEVVTKAATYWGFAGLDVTLGNGDKLFLAGVGALGKDDLVLKDVPQPKPDLPLKLVGTAAADALSGGTGNDTLAGLDGNDLLAGGAGADSLSGGAGHDILRGDAGRDVLRGGVGNDTLTGGADADVFFYTRSNGKDVVTDFAPGTDKLQLGTYAAADLTLRLATQDGVGGLELAMSDGGRIFLQGVGGLQAGDLILAASKAPGLPGTSATLGGTAGDDWLKGGAGAELLVGGAGSDDLQGGAGNDILRGGRDHDGLTGGAGADVLAFARGDGPDWVVDFTPGTDRIRLEGIDPATVLQTVETRWGVSGLELAFGQGDEMFLQGVAALKTGDLVFA